MPTDDYYKKIDEQAQQSVAAAEAAQAREYVGAIDLTPSWVSVVRIYLEVLNSDAGARAKEAACSEILRAAKLADLYVKERKS